MANSLLGYPQYEQRQWQKDDRRYVATVRLNLFGEWVLQRQWWGVVSHRHGEKWQSFESYEAALEALEKVGKQRKNRGYQRR